MRYIFIVLIFLSNLFGHQEHTHEANSSLNYGVFLNIGYRDSDLYPNGVPQTNGYENHGEAGKIELEHYGIFINGIYDENLIYGSEINHHIGASNTSNELIEKLYVGYKNQAFEVKVGRDVNQVSFNNGGLAGYRFINMPLALDSFFDKTLIGDGLFVGYKYGDFSFFYDNSKDKYNKIKRETLKGSYVSNNFELIAYGQKRDFYKTKLTNITNENNTHSHGGDGCDNLVVGEICQNSESLVYGVGGKITFGELDILSEYLAIKNDGTLSTTQYKTNTQTTIYSAYLQIASNYDKFYFGGRGEVFWFDRRLDGSGATAIAQTLGEVTGNEKRQYLNTLNLHYKMDKYQTFHIEKSYSSLSSSLRFNYVLTFSN